MLTLFLVVLLLGGGALLVLGLILYNSLIQVRHGVDQAWSNIDVLLKQRHDELPKLLDTVGAYMTYERDLLERITLLRAQTASATTPAARMQAEGALGAGIGRLLAVAEGYPELKANATFAQLQARISALEEQIAHRREFYNAAVNLNNVRMEQVPDRFLAGLARMTPRTLFEAAAVERADVNIGAALRSG